MFKLLHIHTNITFIYASENCINENFINEVLFIGSLTGTNINKLNQSGFSYKIIENIKENVHSMVEYANQFDGVFFYDLDNTKTQILLGINSDVKTVLRFFGFELYGICAKDFLSELTWNYEHRQNNSFPQIIKKKYYLFKRKLRVAFNREFDVKLDNQKKIYQKLTAVMMINKFEYIELSKLFYLPKLIEIQFTNHVKEAHKLQSSNKKSNKVILGNSGHRWNNHIDLLHIVKSSNNPNNIEFDLFFSYGTDSVYSNGVKVLAGETKNVKLIENFLSKDEFETIYSQASALVINSYRQHAIGNILTAIQNGCKIYLNKKSSTFHWLISKGFLISEVDDLKKDIELGNIRLSVEEQQGNINCFTTTVKNYTVQDFTNHILTVLK